MNIKAQVKILAGEFTRIEDGAPTTASVGELGDLWLDNDGDSLTYGNTYELTAITSVPAYTWTQRKELDYRIDAVQPSAEVDYLIIRGKAYDEDSDGNTVYPADYKNTLAEMVCYVLGLGQFQGRGKTSAGVSDRSQSYEHKVNGYPVSIISRIEKFVGVV